MKLSVIFIYLLIISIAVFDFWIIDHSGKTESISAYFIRWSYKYPSFTFLIGFVAGHLFWRMKSKDISKGSLEL